MRRTDIKAMVAAKAEIKVFQQLMAVAQHNRRMQAISRSRAGNLHLSARRIAFLARAFVGWAAEVALGAVGTRLGVETVKRQIAQCF